MRIAMVLADVGSWGPIKPETWRDQPLGGRERNMLMLASELSAWNEIDLYTPTEKPVAVSDTLRFFPMPDWMDKPKRYDVMFGMEVGALFWPRRAPLQVLWLQVADHIAAGPRDDEVVDYTAFLTGWHQWYVRETQTWIDPARCLVIPNMHEHLKPDWKLRRKPHQMIYMSSPDRGLWHALSILDGIRQAIPDATLKVLYGAQEYAKFGRWSMFRVGEMLMDILDEHPGAEYLGKLSHSEAMQHLRESAMLLYPCDAEASSETFCTVVLEACATRTPMVISNAGCLEVQWRDVGFLLRRPINREAWVGVACRILEDVDIARRYTEQQGDVAELYDSTNVALRVHALFEGLLGTENRAQFVEEWQIAVGAA